MPSGDERRHLDNLIGRCYVGLDTASLRAEALRRLRTLLSIDAVFFATVDPITLLFTSAVAEQPLASVTPLFLDNEFGDRDVNRFTDLAARRDPVASLDQATRGTRADSRRYTEIMAPLDLGDELRVVLRTGGRSWGVMCLHRSDAAAGFSEREAALLRRLSPHLAEGLRRAQLTNAPKAGTAADATGIIILDQDLRLVSINPAAERWLAELAETQWPESTELPLPVYAAAARLNSAAGEERRSGFVPELRLRTGTGQWLQIHASRLAGAAGPQTAVILEHASPSHLVSVLLAAHGLTPAQERVAALILQGRTTQQIAAAAHISAHTVQEHLKAVFDKFGVRSRRELVAVVLAHRE